MITLTTDFGDSAYAGAMRGSILRVHPDARVVDVTHAVPAHDVLAGALALYAAAPHFPDGTIHVAVVDPGVGTARRPLLVEAEGAAFIGPDNGILMPAAERMGVKRVRVLDEPRYWRTSVSAVFHGRDVFGPVAAHLDRGARFEDVGSVVDDPVRLDFGRPEVDAESVTGRVLAVDAFGNVTTNVPAAMAPAGAEVRVLLTEARLTLPHRAAYGDVPEGEAVLVDGSTGFLEIAVNRRSAAALFKLKAGDRVRFTSA